MARSKIATSAAKKRAEKEKEKISEAIKVLNEVEKLPVEELPKYYTCVRCGKRKKSGHPAEDNFYKSLNSSLFSGNDGYIHLCKDCLIELYNKLYEIYHDKRISMIIICSLTNNYFNEAIFEQVYFKADFKPGVYFRQLNLVSSKNGNNTFADYLADLYEKNSRDTSSLRDEIMRGWQEGEIANRKLVVKTLGYEPFADKGYLPDELRFLYNTAASYMTDEVMNDSHKLQQVIIIAKEYMDVERITKRITERFSKRENDDDTKTTKDLIDMRNNTIKTINEIAADNGISAKNKSQRNANTITSIMAEMLDVGVKEAKVNIIEAKLSKSYEEIAAANAKALIDELNLTSDDYARMLAEQAELVAALQKKNDEVTELLRLKTIEFKQKEKEVAELQEKLREVTESDSNS